jgi:hypothetical protein
VKLTVLSHYSKTRARKLSERSRRKTLRLTTTPRKNEEEAPPADTGETTIEIQQREQQKSWRDNLDTQSSGSTAGTLTSNRRRIRPTITELAPFTFNPSINHEYIPSDSELKQVVGLNQKQVSQRNDQKFQSLNNLFITGRRIVTRAQDHRNLRVHHSSHKSMAQLRFCLSISASKYHHFVILEK